MSLKDILLGRDKGFDPKALGQKAVNDQAFRKEVFECLFSGMTPIDWRAGWILMHACDIDPGVADGKDKQLLSILNERKASEGVLRGILRVYTVRDVPEQYSSATLDTCYVYIKSPAYPPAIRAFSITVAYNISKAYPELLDELSLVLKECLKQEDTAAVTSRARQTLKLIARQENKRNQS